MTFDPRAHAIKLPGRKDKNGNYGPPVDYLQVKHRVRWLRDEHPDASIQSSIIGITEKQAIFQVTVSVPGGGSATATGSETSVGFADYIGKAETVALGRALAILGYGIDFADEFDERKEEADPREYEPAQAAVMTPRPVTKMKPEPNNGFPDNPMKSISDQMPQSATPAEIREWFERRLKTVRPIKYGKTEEEHRDKVISVAQNVAITLDKGGLKEKDRADAYEWLTGVRSGKEMTAEQLYLLNMSSNRVADLHRCAIAMREELAEMQKATAQERLV